MSAAGRARVAWGNSFVATGSPRYVLALLLLISLLVPLAAWSQQLAPIPALDSPVVDTTGTLDASALQLAAPTGFTTRTLGSSLSLAGEDGQSLETGASLARHGMRQ